LGQRFKCTICGWIFDPEVGVPDKGVKPGTAFEDAPDDFRCPECGAAKKWFQPV